MFIEPEAAVEVTQKMEEMKRAMAGQNCWMHIVLEW